MASKEPRIEWIDAAKGITICLVVWAHVLLTMNFYGYRAPFAVEALTHFLSYCRMPTFFLCAGIAFHFAAYKGQRYFFERRVATPLWIVFVWTCASYLFDGIPGYTPLYPWRSEDKPLSEFLWSPFGILWFFYALSMSSGLAFAVRKKSPAFMIAVAVVCALGIRFLEIRTSPTQGWHLALSALRQHGIVLFIVGFALARPLVAALAFQPCRMAIMVASAGLFFVSDIAFGGIPNLMKLVGAFLLVSVTVSLVAEVPFAGIVLRSIGARSMHILVSHQFIVVIVANGIFGKLGVQSSTALSLAVTALAVYLPMVILPMVDVRVKGLLFGPPVSLKRLWN